MHLDPTPASFTPHLANHNRVASAEPPTIDYHAIDYGRLLSLTPA